MAQKWHFDSSDIRRNTVFFGCQTTSKNLNFQMILVPFWNRVVGLRQLRDRQGCLSLR